MRCVLILAEGDGHHRRNVLRRCSFSSEKAIDARHLNAIATHALCGIACRVLTHDLLARESLQPGRYAL